MSETAEILDALKRRAKAGDQAALQQLRDSGYFTRKKAAQQGFPISPAQRRLWVLDQMLTDRATYNLPSALLLEGRLDVVALRKAIERIVQRHESLRTTFAQVDDEPRQFIHEAAARFEEVDMEGSPEAEAKALCLRHALEPFDLKAGPLLRTCLIRLAPERHLLVVVMHHIVSDAWSVRVFARELSALYNAFSVGASDPLPPLKLQYKDYAAWQNQQLSGDAEQEHRSYWQQKFSGHVAGLDLPADCPRPPVKTFAGKILFGDLGGLVARLEQLSRAQGVTLFMTLTALVKILIHRYTGAEEITVGTAVAGRDHVDLEPQIGFYVNTLAIRDRLAGLDSFREVLSRVKQSCLEGYEHQSYPFDRLTAELRLDRHPSHSPLFDVAVQLHHAEREDARLYGIRAAEYDIGFQVAKFDASFDFVRGDDDALSFTIEFNTDLFADWRIRRMISHLQQLSAAAVEAPDRPIASLDLLTPTERAELLHSFNPVPTRIPANKTVVQLFEARAQTAFDCAAVALEDEVITYVELNRRANQLASFFRAHGVRPEVSVAVCMERSIDATIASLAVLKAGGVYVPLDPLLPPQRLAVMIHECKPVLILAHQPTCGRLPQTDCPAVCLEAIREAIVTESEDNLLPSARPEHAAYIIYTSGSIGVPKGVVVEHRNLVNVVCAMMENLAIVPEDRCLAFSTCSFDPSIYETFLPLIAGACLVLVPREVIQDAAVFEEYLRRLRVSTAGLTPSFLSTLDDQKLVGLRVMLTGGEPPPPLVARRCAQRMRYINAYGPTEATVISHWFEVRPEDAFPFGVPIGRPVQNTRSYIIDRRFQLVPPGVAGEIVIGGVGLARGYLNGPDLTADRFVPDPYSTAPGARMYRTGDLGRYRPDGAIEFLGRLDSQVKVRGYRIELGEIEAVLRQYPAVREAAVTLQEEGSGDRRLVGYLVANQGEGFSLGEVRAYLRARLPEYMVPVMFVLLESLPLTISGKVDRKALPPPSLGEPALGGKFVPARSDLERLLAGIFAELLGVAKVGIQDNFFDLGGHSLLAIRLVSRLREALKLGFSITQVFENPTVAGLAEALCQGEKNGEQLERIARALLRLANLSDEEKRRLLEKKGAQLQRTSSV